MILDRPGYSQTKRSNQELRVRFRQQLSRNRLSVFRSCPASPGLDFRQFALLASRAPFGSRGLVDVGCCRGRPRRKWARAAEVGEIWGESGDLAAPKATSA